jgi:hypothetical protein
MVHSLHFNEKVLMKMFVLQSPEDSPPTLTIWLCVCVCVCVCTSARVYAREPFIKLCEVLCFPLKETSIYNI